MLSVLEQNSDLDWRDLIRSVAIPDDNPSDMPEIEDSSDTLADFTL